MMSRRCIFVHSAIGCVLLLVASCGGSSNGNGLTGAAQGGESSASGSGGSNAAGSTETGGEVGTTSGGQTSDAGGGSSVVSGCVGKQWPIGSPTVTGPFEVAADKNVGPLYQDGRLFVSGDNGNRRAIARRLDLVNQGLIKRSVRICKSCNRDSKIGFQENFTIVNLFCNNLLISCLL